jgi:dihydrofolate reductase
MSEGEFAGGDVLRASGPKSAVGASGSPGIDQGEDALTPNPSPEGRGERSFSVVVAMDKQRGIGYRGDLPWPKLKGDMKFFRELTSCPDRAAVEKRWGLKAEESPIEKTWDEVSAMLKWAHPLPVATDDKRNAVIMGRKTWESLPEQYRPLPDRFNGVLSALTVLQRKSRIGDRTWAFFDSALSYLKLGLHSNDPIHDLPSNRPAIVSEIFVIGGGKVYSEAVELPECGHLYITEIDAEFPCDTFFPTTPDFNPVLSSPWIDEGRVRYRFRRYDRVS